MYADPDSVLEDDLLELMEPVGESGTAWSITAASSAPPGRGQGQALVRKPGAFARHCFGERRFRPANFRLADDSLRQCRGLRAAMDHWRNLHLAVTIMASPVDSSPEPKGRHLAFLEGLKSKSTPFRLRRS